MADLRLEEIRAARLKKRQALLEGGHNPYPAEVRRTHTTADVNGAFDALVAERTPIMVVGRVIALRAHGQLVFADLVDGYGKVQLYLSSDALHEDFSQLTWLDVGDFVQVAGFAHRTQRGAPSILARELHIVSKSIRPLPKSWYGLRDHEARFRSRELDLLLNDSATAVLKFRGQVIAWWRAHLAQDGYMEFETPILQPLAGGAAARPFVTHHHALGMDLGLRIAAELYLKRLLVGGYEKVFEIGRYFRNEGIDRQHNPEFTMLEAQWAYADYEDYMTFTEDKLAELCQEIRGTTQLRWQGTHLSFDKPLARARYTELLREHLDVDILALKEAEAYVPLLEQHGLKLPQPYNYATAVDELYKKLVRPTLQQPVILYDYPVEMAPLAKPAGTDERVAEKFQLVAAGMEVVNAYTELNDPVRQREFFENQQAERADDEAMPGIDWEYLRAMEHGMPPNAGWGLGVDRLVMILADVPHVRDTMAFPLLRPSA